ncbi:uncharacterized protein LOC117106311 [Anneissia japonica]|uniref:uncharacterized protein LOC117106311 n=1 Tax=Anneissia japonica TaxID=1529436 RepID=UPI0014259888|nr:uncharacterized protein LOC117106311 [Anneissia japonica]
MMVFPGRRFAYSPLAGAPEGSFLGRSHNGWVDSEVFFKWVSNHFLPSVQKAGVTFPIILFVDGHASHLNLETCKFCRDNGIVLYCFPSHCSHIMQPLDLAVFGPLKSKWRKAVQQFQFSNLGEVVEKWTFSKVFNEPWTQSSTKKNASSGFRKAGLFPFSLDAIDKRKLKPSCVFDKDDTNHHWTVAAQEPAVAAMPGPAPESAAKTPELAANSEVSATDTLVLVESLLGEQRVSLYKCRYDNGYELADDSQYTTWSKLKAKAIREQLQSKSRPATSKHPCLSLRSRSGILSPPVEPSSSSSSSTASCSAISSPSTSAQDPVSSAFREHLRIPKKQRTLSANKIKSREMSKALSSEQFIAYAETKASAKAALKNAKKQRKDERKEKKDVALKMLKINGNICSKCRKKYDSKSLWIGCECGRWFHCATKCCGIDEAESMTKEEIELLDWYCNCCS